ncbi:MAG: hypothetical protein ACYC7E_13320 [Armatimonadota bacterium]
MSLAVLPEQIISYLARMRLSGTGHYRYAAGIGPRDEVSEQGAGITTKEEAPCVLL